MWPGTIALRYVSYKNADSNLHERICAMAMMAKNLLWSCAPIVAPRPPINPQRPNHAMERTPNGACGKQRDIDGQPEGGLAGKPCIKAFGVAHLIDSLMLFVHPSGFPSMSRL